MEITVDLPDRLAARIGASGLWFSMVFELGMTHFKNPEPLQAKAELVEFLSQNPTPQEVLKYEISDKYQKRINRLSELNGEEEIKENERQELEEWVKFNHICILLSAKATKYLKR